MALKPGVCLVSGLVTFPLTCTCPLASPRGLPKQGQCDAVVVGGVVPILCGDVVDHVCHVGLDDWLLDQGVAKLRHEMNEGRHPTSKYGGSVVLVLSLVQHGGPDLHLLDGSSVVQVPVLVVRHVENKLLVLVIVGGLAGASCPYQGTLLSPSSYTPAFDIL
jgi:hypothetical protein